MANSYAKNSFFSVIGTFVYSVSMMLMMPILVRVMGSEEYALFKLSMISILSYLVLIELGVQTGARRALAQAYIKGEAFFNKTLGNTFLIYTFVAFVIFLISIPLIIYAPSFFEIKNELIFPFRCILSATVYYIVFILFSTPLNCTMLVFGRYEYTLIPLLLGKVSFLFLGLILTYFFGNALIMLSISIVLMSFISYPLTLYVIRKKVFPNFKIDFSDINKKICLSIFSFGIKITLVQSTEALILGATDFFIAKYYGLAEVTMFAIAILAGNQIMQYIATLSDPVFAKICDHLKNNEMHLIKESFTKVLKISISFYLLMSIPIIIYMKEGVGILFGEQYSTNLISIIAIILTLRAISSVLASVSISSFKAMGNINKLAMLNITFCLIAVIALFIVVKTHFEGMIGVAIVLSIVLLLRAIIIFSMASKTFQFSFAKECLMIIKKIALAFILIYAPLLLLKYYFPPLSLISSLIQISIAGIYTLCIVVFIEPEFKTLILNKIKRKL